MTPRPKQKNNTNKTHILTRYGIITVLFFLFSAALVVKLFDTTVIEAPAWNERAHKELSRTSVIAPERGNILASNGNILACNLKVYDIKIDLRHNKVKDAGLPWAKIDSLADSLDYHYPRVRNLDQHPDTFKKYSWHTRLKKEFEKDFEKRPRALRLAQKKTIEDFEKIRNFPYLKDFKGKGTRIPVYKEEKNVRIYPYGRMAYRSIGRVNENSETGEFHGYSGLEKDLDTLLYGKPGEAKKVALTSGISNWVSQAAVRGFDIHTTIDIDLQDMLEQELLNICAQSGAEWGTAILMEVATGEIKAISNIELLDNGTYGEALNRAVQAFEPGSVMKPISLMIAFEDGLVKSVNDIVDCSPFQKTTDPHAPSVKTMKQVIEMSSNTGISRVIFRKYAADPSKFYDRLASIGFFEPINSGIAGECLPRVRKLLPKDSRGNNITMTARHLDLARQAYGYNTEIPPLYTLSFYNAIANGGKYVRPHLVRSLISEDGRDSILPINSRQICSPENARRVRECIREVVWGEHGTARAVRDDRVEVVGKTGTAFPVENGVYNRAKRRYAFAGFFPYDQPRYSCMALVLGPAGGSANRTSGQVVKNMAVKMYARGMLNNASTYTNERSSSVPVIAASSKVSANELSKALGINKAKRVKGNADGDNNHSLIPNVIGYDAPTAVKILERRGVDVIIRGSGRVVSQSIAQGTKVSPGTKIILSLRV
ncbi:MAG: PASTA domain-containing protein [Muribaculaceae bacterium]|nr:PASTA domain-containing protein [Muribaculaceae bacterium]MDE6754664.1 PASTA domain-containing protein [Muribaculaceae bacterium]